MGTVRPDESITMARSFRHLNPYAFAVVMVTIAWGLTLPLDAFGIRYFPFFYVAVCLSAWYGGWRPGLLATGLSIPAIASFIAKSPNGGSLILLLKIGLLAGALLTVSLFTAELKTARQRVEKLSQQQIQESNVKLQQALAAARMGTWDLDVRTNTIDWSPEHEQLFGMAPGTFDGRYETLEQILHPDDRAELLQKMQQTRESGEVYRHEFRIILPDGSIRWIEGRGQWLYDADGTPIRMTGTVLDITDRKQADCALRWSEERYRALITATAQAVWVTNARGEVVEPIPSWCELTGISDADSRGFGWLERIHPDDRKRTLQAWTEAITHKTLYEVELLCQVRDGSYRNFWVRGVPIIDETGEVREWIGIYSDITDRKRAELALRKLNEELEKRVNHRTEQLSRVNQMLHEELSQGRQVQITLAEQAYLLDLAHDTITTRTPDNEITFWNQGAEKMYGWTRTDALGKNIHQLLKTQFSKPLTEIEAILDNQGYWEGELIHRHRNGSPLTVASRWVLHRDSEGNPLKILEINNDITHRKRAEEQLRISSERISLANAELTRAARLKDEFLAGMSHELRTPLNAVLGLSEALLEEVFGPLTEQQRSSLLTIEQSGQHLLELINDILDLSKIESGKMELEIAPIRLQELCQACFSFVKQQAHARHIHLSLEIAEGLEEIEADDRRIRQVLINLLSNAVKFTPEGGRVQLTVETDPLRETVDFKVIDTGIGISSEDMEKLFQPFVQLDSSLSRRHGGTGLGLALVRRIVDLHQGSVIVDSEVGRGSCFTVSLPQRSIHSVTTGVGDRSLLPLNPSSNSQALVVEDSEVAADQISRYLFEVGMSTIVHPVAEGVLTTALQLQPRVIILDILLPDRSGWEVLTELKANPVTAEIPVIIISVVDDRARGLKLGAAEYLVKPINRQKLQAILNQMLASDDNPAETTALIVAPNQLMNLPLILLVEDNEANIEVLLSYLQARGLRLIVARNGLEGVQMAKAYQPDAILMDIQLPEVDGLEAIRRIREDEALVETPIIALTALAMPGDRERCLAAGANEYMTKPVSLRLLLQTLKQQLPAIPDF